MRNAQDLQEVATFVKDIQFFKKQQIEGKDLQELSELFWYRYAECGDSLFKYGEKCEEMYILIEGAVEFSVDPLKHPLKAKDVVAIAEDLNLNTVDQVMRFHSYKSSLSREQQDRVLKLSRASISKEILKEKSLLQLGGIIKEHQSQIKNELLKMKHSIPFLRLQTNMNVVNEEHSESGEDTPSQKPQARGGSLSMVSSSIPSKNMLDSHYTSASDLRALNSQIYPQSSGQKLPQMNEYGLKQSWADHSSTLHENENHYVFGVKKQKSHCFGKMFVD